MSASEDPELAALLDEGLFAEDEAHNTGPQANETLAHEEAIHDPADPENSSCHEEEQPTQHAAKRIRTEAFNRSSNSHAAGGAQQAAPASICPPHPSFFHDMCVRCGKTKAELGMETDAFGAGVASDAAVTKIKHLHHRTALEVSANEAARIAADSVNRLLASRRLVLVLDLDHTLLNTVRETDLVGKERELATQQLAKQAQQLEQAQQQQQQGCPASSAGAAAAAGDVQGSEQQAAATGPGTGAQTATEPAAADGSAGSASGTAAAAGPGSDGEAVGKQQISQGRQGQLVCPRLFHLRDKGLWTKLRPGVESFLAKVSQLYELHIYTMGDKGYAALMADLLDPEHRLFVGRVVSAADSTKAGVKDLDVLLADENLVLILDDTEHVWEKHRANLIQVERYHYFGASARIFHRDAQSPLEHGTDEPEVGGTLDLVAQLLTRIHERMFGPADQQQQQQQQQTLDQANSQQQQLEQLPQQQQLQQGVQGLDQQQQQAAKQQPSGRRVIRRPQQQQQSGNGNGSSSSSSRPSTPGAVLVRDVRQCLFAEERAILSGCNLVFSRCWPTNETPSENGLWRLAQTLGGTCSMVFTPGVTTHVVVRPDRGDPSGVPLTDKVQAAQRAGVPVVHPDWLVACKFAWARVPEAKYTLPGYKAAAGKLSSGSSRMMALGSAAGAALEREKLAVLKSAGRVDS